MWHLELTPLEKSNTNERYGCENMCPVTIRIFDVTNTEEIHSVDPFRCATLVDCVDRQENRPYH
jgi:hypothetical protein